MNAEGVHIKFASDKSSKHFTGEKTFFFGSMQILEEQILSFESSISP